MNQKSLFKVLQVILRRYSKLSTCVLVDHYLRIKILFDLQISTIQKFLMQTDLSQGLTAAFTSQKKADKTFFMCIIIDHPYLIALTAYFLQSIADCIVCSSIFKQSNNILGRSVIANSGEKSKLIIFKAQRQDLNQLSQSLDCYLSVCQLFHGHLHLTVNLFEAQPNLAIENFIQQIQGDQFEGIVQEGYFRILEERASKITLQQISQICNVTKIQWGQIFICQDGFDALIIWITQRYLPKLGVSPRFKIPTTYIRKYPQFLSSQIGCTIFKRKQQFKEKLQDLRCTTIILNCQKYEPRLQKQIIEIVLQFFSKFCARAAVSSQTTEAEESVKAGQRVCQLLNLEQKSLLARILRPL